MLLIQQGTLYTMESDGPISADLLIHNGKIEKIAPDIPITDEMQVLDATGLLVFPGFIDAHSHIGISEEKITGIGDECNENTTPATPYLRAIDSIHPMDSAFHNALASGITGVMAGPGSSNPVGGQFAFIKTYGRCMDDMIVLAPAAMKISFGENPMTTYGMNGNSPSTRMGIAGIIREELFNAKQYLDNTPEDSGEKNFRLECYRELFAKKIPLKAHVHRTDDIFTAIRIAKEFDLDLTLDHCTEGHLIAGELAKHGFPAIVGPSMSARSKKEVCESDFKTPGILKNAGLTIALTTDHPVCRLQYLPLCAALAVKEGMSEYEALRAITIDAARICRVDHRLGSLAAGKDADLCLWDGNPLELTSSVIKTLINGDIVWEKEKG
ncbi:MAG: amidohydrolase [Lachnospiraceae bacterium]|nr:amidohydrolase [Lachnospiraceae bacterium]MBP3570176.1 amidohydrolase [Lachnospiraceae bacterium]